MGAAFAVSFLQGGMLRPDQLTIVEPFEEKHAALKETLGCPVISTLNDDAAISDIVILAVKPQVYKEVCAELSSKLQPNQIVSSIMAGVSLAALESALDGHKKLVRAMPNLPAQIGKGMTVFLCSPSIAEEEARYLRDLFAASGKALEVEDEKLIHASTAVSGSGPGFVLYIIEAFLEAASEIGFSKQEARMLVSQTFLGAQELWDSRAKEASELRTQVTSPGGTTAAGIESFEQNKLKAKIVKGVRAAFERSLELSS